MDHTPTPSLAVSNNLFNRPFHDNVHALRSLFPPPFMGHTLGRHSLFTFKKQSKATIFLSLFSLSLIASLLVDNRNWSNPFASDLRIPSSTTYSLSFHDLFDFDFIKLRGR
ncbi:hypothetical protein RJT34_00254 [Clitoria ternatea]|uniref:Transmembrane protein n=1 Tax=Clitoria ternatea TaxID=43366 RepID=A0AAN9Q0K4_CLITE